MRPVFLRFGALHCCLILLWASPARAATLGGRAVDSKGEGVAGAQIFVPQMPTEAFEVDEAEIGWREIKADAAGRFSFEMPDAVKLAAPGETKTDAIVFAPGFAARGAVLQGKENIIALESGVRRGGKVTDDKGAPLAGVVVRLLMVDTEGDDGGPVAWSKKSPLGELFSARSGMDGSWEIANLPASGIVFVKIDDPRFVGHSTYLTGTDTATLVATPGATLRGRVVSPDKLPLAGLKISVVAQERRARSSSSARSEADGSFIVTGVAAGQVNVRVSDAKGDWAGASLPAQSQAGQEQTLPDIEVQKGVLLNGKVVDDAGGAPLLGALVVFSGENGSFLARPTGKDGEFAVRVLPGTYNRYFSLVPAGYLRTDNNERTVVKESAPPLAPQVLRLKRGTAITGIARDAAGKIAANATLQIGERWSSQPVRVNEKGEWKSDALAAGTVALAGAGEWEVVSPKTIKVPAPGAPNPALELQVRRVVLGEAKGRAVLADGSPVAGVAVELRLFFDAARNARSSRTVTSDAQGRFSLPKLRPEQSVELVKASKAGFQIVSTGKTRREGNDWELSDIVLSALDGRVIGRITDAAGVPIAGAKVTALGRAAFDWALSGEDGSFELPLLPDGKITLLAAQGTRFGRLETTAGQTVSLPIAARPAMEMEKEWQALAAPENQGRGHDTLEKIAALEPDRAWEWASRGEENGENGEKTERRAVVIETLAARDAGRALTWAPAKLAELPGGSARFRAGMALARAALTVPVPAPDVAQQWLAEQSAALSPLDFSSGAADKIFALAGLAARLNQKDAAGELLERGRIALLHADADEEEGQTDSSDAWAKGVAFGGAAFLEMLVQGEIETAQLRFLTAGATIAANGDPALAQSLGRKIEALSTSAPVLQMDAAAAKAQQEESWKPSSRWLIDRALPGLAVSIAARDAKLARTLIDELEQSWERPTALAALGHHLARAGKREEAVAALREAALGTRYNPDEAARIAYLAGVSDPELGRELKGKIIEGIQKPEADIFDFGVGVSVAPYVFYFGSEDPAAGRLLLEAEWQERQTAPQTEARGENYQLIEAKKRLARAMAPLDTARALEMAAALGKDGHSRLRAQILTDALLPADARRLSSLADFGDNDELFH